MPHSVWAELPVEIIGTHCVQGIVPKQECVLPVQIGYLDFMIIDEEMNSFGPTRLSTFLADTDWVPLLLGFRDVLSRVRLVADHQSGEAFIEG